MLLAAVTAVAAMLAVGCASSGDVANLQTQVDLLRTSTAVQIEAATVKAGLMCTAQCDKGMSNKLDIMFNKVMVK